MREEFRGRKARVAHIGARIARLLRNRREEIGLQYVRVDREHRRNQREQKNQEAEQLFAAPAEHARRHEPEQENQRRIDQLAGPEERRERAERKQFPRADFLRAVSELKNKCREEKHGSD